MNLLNDYSIAEALVGSIRGRGAKLRVVEASLPIQMQKGDRPVDMITELLQVNSVCDNKFQICSLLYRTMKHITKSMVYNTSV